MPLHRPRIFRIKIHQCLLYSCVHNLEDFVPKGLIVIAHADGIGDPVNYLVDNLLTRRCFGLQRPTADISEAVPRRNMVVVDLESLNIAKLARHEGRTLLPPHP